MLSSISVSDLELSISVTYISTTKSTTAISDALNCRKDGTQVQKWYSNNSIENKEKILFDHPPSSLRATARSLDQIVTKLVWMATKLVSSKNESRDGDQSKNQMG